MDAASAFTHSTLYSILIQAALRVTTFVTNGIVLRYVSPAVLGVANVRLMLLYTSISFLAREPFRKACTYENEHTWQKKINVVWLCPVLTLIVGSLMILVWLFFLSRPNSSQILYYEEAVFLYALSVFIESLAEPVYIATQASRLVKIKAQVECSYFMLRQLLSAFFTIFFPHWGIIAFAYAMLASSAVYLLLFYALFARAVKSPKIYADQSLENEEFLLVPKKFSVVFFKLDTEFDQSTFSLLGSFFRHSFVKQLLTEGERYLMAFFDLLNFSDQGIYDVVSNLGSLVARLIFAPIEENAYVYFTAKVQRGVSLKRQNPESIAAATKMLLTLLKLVLLIGLIMTVYGIPYAFLALKIYGGDLLSSGTGPTLLRWFCFYLLFLAANGVTEAFVFAIMQTNEVIRHHNWMTLFFVAFLISSAFLIRLFGSVGFILANCFNMFFRICYSVFFIRTFYGSSTLLRFSAILPPVSVILMLVASILITLLSNALFCCSGLFLTAAHVLVGAVCLLATLTTMYSSDMELSDFARSYFLKSARKIE